MDFEDRSKRLHDYYTKLNEADTSCAVCRDRLETTPAIVFKDNEGKDIKICTDCMICDNCESLVQLSEDLEIDESNWVTVSKPCFASGWACMSNESLKQCFVDEKVLFCCSCRIDYCTNCKNVCKTTYHTDECDQPCDRCECDSS